MVGQGSGVSGITWSGRSRLLRDYLGWYDLREKRDIPARDRFGGVNIGGTLNYGKVVPGVYIS